MTNENTDHQGTPERSTSGTVRRRRPVRRGPASADDDSGEEFVRVRSVAEEPGGRVFVDGPDDAEHIAPDAITPDEVTSGPVVDATKASLPASDSATLALVLDAVRSFLEGHDGLGGDHPVTQDRLERLRRVAVLVENP
ncbi:MAG: hypothetical protein RIR49_545 [Actinomycetota bacterium]|jgi:hypothetical protein